MPPSTTELECPSCGSTDWWALYPVKDEPGVYLFCCRSCQADTRITARAVVAAEPYLARFSQALRELSE